MICPSSAASQSLAFLSHSTCSFHWAVLSHGKANGPKAFLNATRFCKGHLKIDCHEVKFKLHTCCCLHLLLVFKRKGGKRYCRAKA